MIYSWLKHNDRAKNVIVFFNGWGFDESVVKHLNINSDTNVLVVSDYGKINRTLPDLGSYESSTVIAWSFGVANYHAWQMRNPDVFDTKIAINGTVQGLDRKFGIPEKVVVHTIANLNAQSYKKFVARCYNNAPPPNIESIAKAITDSEIKAKRIELQCINDRYYEHQSYLIWDAIWISEQDQIFPTKNQKRAWEGNSINLIDASHVPFSHWQNWQDILAS